jgi:hypothetical protein
MAAACSEAATPPYTYTPPGTRGGGGTGGSPLGTGGEGGGSAGGSGGAGPVDLRSLCATGNIAYWDGGDSHPIRSGRRTVTEGEWSGEISDAGLFPFFVSASVQVYPDVYDDLDDIYWTMGFSAGNGASEAISIGVYSDTNTVDGPRININSNGPSCNDNCGVFEIFELETDGVDQLLAFGATFEYRCDCTEPTLVGCVHYRAP